jgi:REP element-mobilizing transposase RayT
MSYLKIWIHFVWSTKNRIPFLKDDIRNDIIFHIRSNALIKKVYIDFIGGYREHLHALVSLGGDQSASQIMRLIKGESSYWINKEKLTRLKFQWQDDYYAASIGLPQVESIRNYIRNQTAHHTKIPFDDELVELIKEYNLQKIKD